ncbi:DNA-binding response OmpR family regulator [Sphingobium wenxiniae]|uniref:Response regulator receiver domain-containing protein n=1 Tax=Sphingobium wenxiniae (strain DSM 21828 / CGMCC 1.7748 / JZ-1) TaxID=595605 RepID=A0A562K3S3_SPHWJ|nr:MULTISPECIES: response regulator [Sphingobium]MBB6193403.1 DNA-binding response OmpR family regulator [Sphingobium wenxiniae]TWH90078.1 response regulator receiver domain-containing protein [Sphingobium wenxiniae]WRD77879.1 response regulator [Sphingobium baderi]
MRVLVVEDDPVVGPDLAQALREAGFAVDLSIDGEDAWYRGDVEDYALAVLDLGLPKLDGLSVLKRWRSEGRSFPVLILSARSDWTEKVEGIQAGADDYVGKPFAISCRRPMVRSRSDAPSWAVLKCAWPGLLNGPRQPPARAPFCGG